MANLERDKRGNSSTAHVEMKRGVYYAKRESKPLVGVGMGNKEMQGQFQLMQQAVKEIREEDHDEKSSSSDGENAPIMTSEEFK